MAEPRQRVDWDALKPHYCAGVRALKDIGAEFGCSDAAIIKHAKKEGWTRNLAQKVQDKADAKVAAALVAQERADSPAGKLTEAVRVEVESEVQARIRLSHRRDVSRMRALVMNLLDELEVQTRNPETFETLRELVSDAPDPDDKAGRARAERLQQAFDRALSLSGRTKTVRELTESVKALIALERQAYGVDKWADQVDPAQTVDPVQGAKAMAFVLARGKAELDKQGT
jgi:hypothetical protein